VHATTTREKLKTYLSHLFRQVEIHMGKCDICGKNGKNLTLLGTNHKELGHIKVCSDCWEKLYSQNKFVGGTTSSSGSCPTCG
jgi:hypothetical protein